jgi:nucleolar protein 58
MISNATGRVKGKMSRALASKSALCVRYDALAEEENNELGLKSLEYLEKRMAYLEKEQSKSEGGRVKRQFGK